MSKYNWRDMLNTGVNTKETSTGQHTINDLKEEVSFPLEKGKERYTIKIPTNVEDMIRYFCTRIHDVEWSGILFYDTEGTFEDNNLAIICKDIYLMDIGNVGFTSFNMSPEVISYMATKPELLDCKTGLIHSHNNMAIIMWSYKTELIAGTSDFIEIIKGQSAANQLVKSLLQVQRLADETIKILMRIM